jgi:hypothetical protein
LVSSQLVSSALAVRVVSAVVSVVSAAAIRVVWWCMGGWFCGDWVIVYDGGIVVISYKLLVTSYKL